MNYVRITAIGEQEILAYHLEEGERLWLLCYRNWVKVGHGNQWRPK